MAIQTGEYIPRLPVISVESHRAGRELVRQIRAIAEAGGVLFGASDRDDPADADGVILADGTDGRWAVERALSLHRAGYHGLIIAISPSVLAQVAIDGRAAGVHVWQALPINPPVFAACARALVRRLLGEDLGNEVRVLVDRPTRTAIIDGQRFKLGARGFALFEYLLQRRDRWVGQREIIERVFCTYHDLDSSIVRVHVRSVRVALGEEFAWMLEGKERFGYRITLRRDSTAGRLQLPHARFRARAMANAPAMHAPRHAPPPAVGSRTRHDPGK